MHFVISWPSKGQLSQVLIVRLMPEQERFGIQQNSESPTKKLSEVVGTFKNGTLEGIAKVKYSDNTTFISNFEHGHPVGMKRTWTSKNNLHDFFYWEGYIKSIAWTRTYDYLIGMNSSFIRDEAHSSLCILVPLGKL